MQRQRRRVMKTHVQISLTRLRRLGARAAVAAGLAAAALMAAPSVRAAEGKPNILFILTDNLGYGELGVYGGGATRGASTTRIDRLAAEGLRLTNMNMEAQCTPSRSSLQTGRFIVGAFQASAKASPLIPMGTPDPYDPPARVK